MTVINDILDFSKLQSGQLRIDPEPFELRDTIDDIMALLGHTAREKKLELIGDMPISIPSQLEGDEGRIRQILINLIGNAIKFTETGHVRLKVTSDEGSRDPAKARLRFDVEDTGIGIPQDKLARIFNQFEQADNTTTRRFGGTGLGLSISQQLAEAMGGSITVSSEFGKGSVFSFVIELPRSELDQQPKSEPEVILTERVPILIVDDLAASRNVLCQQLTRFGANPVCVEDVDKAIHVMARAQNHHGFSFPLVIVDHDMPGKTGLDLVKAVRSIPAISGTKMIIVSSESAESIADAYAEYGVQDIIEKPYPTQRITEVLTHHLSETRLQNLKQVVEQSGHSDGNQSAAGFGEDYAMTG